MHSHERLLVFIFILFFSMSSRAPYISDIRVNSFIPTPEISSCLVTISLEPFGVLVLSLGMLYGISLFSGCHGDVVGAHGF